MLGTASLASLSITYVIGGETCDSSPSHLNKYK